MPGGDGTGPMGMGSMTGRAAGFCAGYGMPGYANGVGGRGFFGRGRGFGGGGRGRRNRFYATGIPGWARAEYDASPLNAGVTEKYELDALKNQAGYFQDALDGIKKLIEELENQQNKG